MSNKKYREFIGRNFEPIEYIINANLGRYHRYDHILDSDDWPGKEDEPEFVTNITLGFEFEKYSTDITDIIEYQSGHGLQTSLLHWIRAILTPELMEHFRNGRIKNLTISIGPDMLGVKHLHKEEEYHDPFENFNLDDEPS